MLVDRDVLIWYLRGHEGAARFLDVLPELALRCHLHGTGSPVAQEDAGGRGHGGNQEPNPCRRGRRRRWRDGIPNPLS